MTGDNELLTKHWDPWFGHVALCPEVVEDYKLLDVNWHSEFQHMFGDLGLDDDPWNDPLDSWYTSRITIDHVNLNAYDRAVNEIKSESGVLKYNVFTRSCVTQIGVVLLKSGVFNLPIGLPLMTEMQMLARNYGMYSGMLTQH